MTRNWVSTWVGSGRELLRNYSIIFKKKKDGGRGVRVGSIQNLLDRLRKEIIHYLYLVLSIIFDNPISTLLYSTR